MNPLDPPDIGEAVVILADRLAAADLHFGHGAATPEDEAAWLVMAVADLPRDGTDVDPQQRLHADAWLRMQQLATQRIKNRRPLAYLLGEAWFCGLRFTINHDVIVPRSPFAELINESFRPWLSEPPGRVLDMCTGSGCMAIAVAKAFPEARVDAVDISQSALAVAAENVVQHEVGDRVKLIQSDLFSTLSGHAYDLIISNPPYVSLAEMRDLPEEYQAEPPLALAAGSDGLELAERILAGAAEHLTPSGMLFLEVGESEPRLHERCPDLPLVWLDFEQGGEGVCCIDRQALCDHAETMNKS